ncbi:MAG: phosphatase PAP2 family protein [Candidatus Zixiibacteriota bacterium]
MESSLYSSTVAGKRSRSRGFIPVDFLILAYVSFTTILLLIVNRPISERVWLIAGNLAIAIVVLILANIAPLSHSRLLRIARRLYPVVLFTFFYEQTSSLIHVFFPGWFDAALSQFEITIFGAQPSLAIEHLYSPMLNDIVMACYVFYYLCLPLGLVFLVLRKKEGAADRLITASALTFFVSYTLFFLYPVEGPRYHLVESFVQPFDGYLFVPLVKRIMDTAAVHGGAMPSSHAAVALIVFWYVMRESRRWGMALAPVILGLTIGCVWGRFHYVSDVAVGALITVVAVWLTEHAYRNRWLGSRNLD